MELLQLGQWTNRAPATGKVLIHKPQAPSPKPHRAHRGTQRNTEEHRGTQRNTDGENGGVFAPIYRYK